MKIFKLNNIPIAFLTQDELKEEFTRLLHTKNSSKLITTFNLDFLRICDEDEEFKRICQSSYLNLPDGYGIILLLKRYYGTNIKRITGSDIFIMLIKLSKELNKKIAIIGGQNHVSEAVHKKLINKYNLNPLNLLCIAPNLYFETNSDINTQILNDVENFNPDIVFAALGCPRQEKWLFNNMFFFKSNINIGIGATLDFFSNDKKRSPIILQNIGLEWFWRLIHEPTRLFKRYIIKDIPFLFINLFKSRNVN